MIASRVAIVLILIKITHLDASDSGVKKFLQHVIYNKTSVHLPWTAQSVALKEAIKLSEEALPILCVRAYSDIERRAINDFLKKNNYYLLNRLTIDEFCSPICDDIYLRSDFFPQIRALNKANCVHHDYVLLTTLYQEKDPVRLQEYYRCIQYNCAHPLIKKIYIFYESPDVLDPVLQDPKIAIIPIKRRPSFGDFFAFAREKLAGERVIISNTDIYFDESLALLAPVTFEKTVVALTRHNIPEYTGSWRRNCYSQDVWIFKAPITILGAQRVFLGYWGCDHDIRDRFIRAGFNVINPSCSVKAWHVHMSDERAYFGNPVTGVKRLPDQLFTIKIAFTTIEDFL